jgi:hypothetical protein
VHSAANRLNNGNIDWGNWRNRIYRVGRLATTKSVFKCRNGDVKVRDLGVKSRAQFLALNYEFRSRVLQNVNRSHLRFPESVPLLKGGIGLF